MCAHVCVHNCVLMCMSMHTFSACVCVLVCMCGYVVSECMHVCAWLSMHARAWRAHRHITQEDAPSTTGGYNPQLVRQVVI